MKKNILIYPCGADNALEIYESLRYSLHLNVYGANSQRSIADLHFENEIISLPNIFDEGFIGKLNQTIEDYKIDLIFPTHDDVVYFFSKNLEHINTEVIGSDAFINEIARYKKKTYEYFKNEPFAPSVFHSLNEVKELPVFCKPNKGHGSIGAFKIKDQSELNAILFKGDNVITEYLPGTEYTVDCFSDKNNRLLYAFPRKRHLVRNGVSHINIEPEKFVVDFCFEIANRINESLKFKGLWFFQVKEDAQGRLKLLEICSRIATTMSFARFKGVNLPLLSVFTYLNLDVEVNIFHRNIELYRYSQTKAKYDFIYDTVYIDFDDTIIVNQKVCIDAIAFIYQAKNQKKKISLITKHEYDLKETLKKYHIPISIFDEIIHIDMADNKYRHVVEPASIFIDNYYKERKEVFERLGVPVFDVEGIKTLLK